MKTLLLQRHAKSSWKVDTLPDHDRPLNKRGRRDAPRMGRLLGELDLIPDLIVSSTANRARTTAAGIAEACGYDGILEVYSELYPTGAAACLGVLQGLYHDARRVLLVGHNPGLEETLNMLTGRTERLPTAALAQIDVPIERWSDLALDESGVLVNIWRPKELPPT